MHNRVKILRPLTRENSKGKQLKKKKKDGREVSKVHCALRSFGLFLFYTVTFFALVQKVDDILPCPEYRFFFVTYISPSIYFIYMYRNKNKNNTLSMVRCIFRIVYLVGLNRKYS